MPGSRDQEVGRQGSPLRPAEPARAQRLSLTALNRALLARQGLLDRLPAPLAQAVETVGALRAQH